MKSMVLLISTQKRRKNMNNKRFYEEDFIPFKTEADTRDKRLDNPNEIYRFLQRNVYKQDNYCRAAAMFLFNHARGITSRMAV